MRRSRVLEWALLAVALAAVSCGSRSPVAPTGPLEGVWTGTIEDSLAGVGTIELRMSHAGPGVSGQWSADFENTASDTAGSIGGTSTGPAVSLFLTPSVPLDCGLGLALSGTLSVDAVLHRDRLTGTYVVLTCDGARSGDVDVTRR